MRGPLTNLFSIGPLKVEVFVPRPKCCTQLRRTGQLPVLTSGVARICRRPRTFKTELAKANNIPIIFMTGHGDIP